MFLKNLRMSRFMNADNGAGTGEANTGNVDLVTETPPAEPTQAEKTFTQADVDKLIQDRIAREKKNQLSKEELKAYQDWKESQKTEEEKRNEALETEKTARTQAEERATALEAKVSCLSKGVIATSVDDVVILAKAMVTEEMPIDKAIDKVLEKYPNFKQSASNNEPFPQIIRPTGGATNPPNTQNKALSAIFGNLK